MACAHFNAIRVLPRAADLWVQASLERNRTFSYLRPVEGGNERMVDLTGIAPAG